MAGSIVVNDLSERLTNVADLTAVANAIRSKGGTTDQLVYPGGFVTAINNIQAGSGSVDIKTSGLTPDCYFCDKDNRTAYLDFSNVITGKYFSFGIMCTGSVFNPDDISIPDDDGYVCLICGMYSGDDSDTSSDCVLLKTGDNGTVGSQYVAPMIMMKYNPITKRIDVSDFFDAAKGDGMLSAIETIQLLYVVNWN